MVWDHLDPEHLAGAAAEQLNTGHRVARLGTVSFVRSGFARVRWDDGRVSDEWVADLVVEGGNGMAAEHTNHCAGCGYDLRRLSTYYVRSGLRWCGACYRVATPRKEQD